MSAFIPVLRGAFLSLSQNRRVRRWVETSRTAHRLTARFIAGLTLEDAVRAAQELRDGGVFATLDHLGENVKTESEAAAALEAARASLSRIAADRLEATISVKVTALGLDLSEDVCRTNVRILVAAARDAGTRVEFDMESTAYTSPTLAIVRDMHREFRSVRAVIQAYLYRSEEDIRVLNQDGIPVRLCKGAYKEPPDRAWPAKIDVDESFLRLARRLLDEGEYPAIATHDERMIEAVIEHVRSRGYDAARFEFQMLYGVRRDLQRRVRREGFRLRLYVPYGAAWYPYFMRRLAERPANVLFLARNLFRE